MDYYKRSLAVRASVFACTALILAAPAYAAGLAPLGFSTNQMAMGGAGVSYGSDSMSAALNPANAASVGHQFQLGVDLYIPNHGYETLAPAVFAIPGDQQTGGDLFLLPNLSYNRPLSNGAVFNVQIYNSGRMSTEYAAPGPYGGGETGLDLFQTSISLTYARKTETLSWGISPTIVAQRFSATGVNTFVGFSSDPVALSDNGDDWSFGIGLKAGVVWNASSVLSFGLSGQMQTKMSQMEKYQGFLVDGGRMDIPASVTVGATWTVKPNIKLMLDYQRILYSGVSALSNDFNFLSDLGDPDGSGFGWDDVDVIKLGVEWKSSDRMTWRAGYAHSQNPLRNSTDQNLFGILMPAISKHHVTFGGSYAYNDTSTFDLALAYSPKEIHSGFGPLGFQPIDLNTSNVSVSVGWTRDF